MTRGRKPDAPGLQAAKGNPGKRRRATTEERAARLAAAADPLVAPAFLGEVAFRKPGEKRDLALIIWRELAPELARNNLLGRMDRYAFARWCVYQAEWIEATRALRKEGVSMMMKNVNGDLMPRRNPAAAHRDRVEIHMGKLEAAYGLTPADRYKVMRDQALAPIGGLFGDDEDERGAKPGPGGVARPADEAEDPIGLMSQLGSPPPGALPN